MLMLGRDVMLPVDLNTEVLPPDEAAEPKMNYAEDLRRGMQMAHYRARQQVRGSARRQKLCYNRQVEGTSYEDHFVWLYNSAK